MNNVGVTLVRLSRPLAVALLASSCVSAQSPGSRQDGVPPKLTPASLALSPATSALLGTQQDVRQTALCRRLKCKLLGTASLPGGLRFTTYNVVWPGLWNGGLFAFQVNGVQRMVGLFGTRLGSIDDDPSVFDPLHVTLDLANEMARSLTGSPLPATADLGMTQREGSPPTVRFDQAKAVPFARTFVAGTATAVSKKAGSAILDGPFYVFYVSDAAEVKRLSRLINRATPAQELTNARQQFLKRNNLSVLATPTCPYLSSVPSKIIFADANKAPWAQWDTVMASNGFIVSSSGDPGSEDRSYQLPGLAASAVLLLGGDTVSDQVEPVCLQ